MIPKNIQKNIGRDAWDYANDRVIKTGKGWNYNVINTQANQIVPEGTSDFKANWDESVMRASPEARDTVETIKVRPGATLTEANVVNYADYNADNEVLMKEYTLSKGLLEQAIANINSDYIKQLKEISNDSNDNFNAAYVFWSLVLHFNGDDDIQSASWAEMSESLNDEFIELVRNVPQQIEEKKYNKEVIKKLKSEFKDRTDNKTESLNHIKEFLCEVFCLIEIIEELNEQNEIQMMVSLIYSYIL